MAPLPQAPRMTIRTMLMMMMAIGSNAGMHVRIVLHRVQWHQWPWPLSNAFWSDESCCCYYYSGGDHCLHHACCYCCCCVDDRDDVDDDGDVWSVLDLHWIDCASSPWMH